MICFYHSKDLDGYCSGAIVKKMFPECEMIGYDYGQPFPFDKCKNEVVIMVDVSLSMRDMWILSDICSLTWIDHHFSAIKDYHEFCNIRTPHMITVLQDGISACEGAWNYFFEGEPMPTSVQLLGEYDTWRNKDQVRWRTKVLPFQFGMRLICNTAESFPQILLTKSADANIRGSHVLNDGHTVLKYQEQSNAIACKAAFEGIFSGYRVIALNIAGANSQAFDSVYDPTRHDIMMPFFFDGKMWKVSMYATKDDIDVSTIAKNHGGGGHKHAAGFRVNKLKDVFPNILI